METRIIGFYMKDEKLKTHFYVLIKLLIEVM